MGFCREGNGFPQIKSKTEIKYINCMENGYNNTALIKSENNFIKPIDEFNQTFTFYYYESKLIFEKNEEINIGFGNGNYIIYLSPNNKLIFYNYQNKSNYINLPLFVYKNEDIIGCGLVYPPKKLNNKLPYIFFTKNGKQIGKAILLENDFESIRPFVWLKCCSIETNFGDYSFLYNVSKHYVINEFYKKEEFK
ncbi:hypothetical protein Mgra_00000590 [Meloidogyne graminicola]|uniref:SPRY domain-containing protein n=1 Tax=Meloidogyne graminicola TaxID=189291 RepID=A0A8T0A4B4_9BILA|nr:hypothetical protein Mgra_00000590 [Meloidogyne graminicola]